ncbi:MAG TPA: SAM-dependent methyltransferase [Ktedonobacter sp.]|nr:SAM-dependent methyltransferase [Ktedonobacter sp.]
MSQQHITNNDIITAWGNAPREAAQQHGDEGDFARQHLLNPALFSLMGDVQGKSILDAGCGQGYLSRMLAKRGAIVMGVEPAEVWYRYCVEREQREPLGITYIQHDLSIFDAMPDSFDIVIANMVFMDIPDYKKAIHNCVASLKHEGSFIFSITHPCFEEPSSEWDRKGYVEVRDYSREFASKTGYAYTFHRPLSTYLNLIVEEGCTFQRMIEPRLDEELVRQYGEKHTRNVYVPQFVVIHAIR